MATAVMGGVSNTECRSAERGPGYPEIKLSCQACTPQTMMTTAPRTKMTSTIPPPRFWPIGPDCRVRSEVLGCVLASRGLGAQFNIEVSSFWSADREPSINSGGRKPRRQTEGTTITLSHRESRQTHQCQVSWHCSSPPLRLDSTYSANAITISLVIHLEFVSRIDDVHACRTTPVSMNNS
jgi:hypothetical protein